jgi:hypothetical protein
MLEEVDRQEGLGWALVIPEGIARPDEIAHLALACGVGGWIAPGGLVRDIRTLNRLTDRRGAVIAAATARLLLTPTLRQIDPPDRRQLTRL